MGGMGEYAAAYILRHLEQNSEEGIQSIGETHLMSPTLAVRGSTAKNKKL